MSFENENELEKNESSLNNENNNENLPKDESKGKKILLNVGYAVIFIVSFFIGKGCTKAIITHNTVHKQYNQQELQLVKDASFVKGFETANNQALEDFCSNSGYIPQDYITTFNNQFSRTINNANGIFDKYIPKKSQKPIIDAAKNAATATYEKEFTRIQSQQKITKQDYCKVFDKKKDIIIQDKKRILKQSKPNMCLD